MLEIRPICENCAAPLPPESPAATICSFECTFCRTCADEVLHNVCPNCGGGFSGPAGPTDDELERRQSSTQSASEIAIARRLHDPGQPTRPRPYSAL